MGVSGNCGGYSPTSFVALSTPPRTLFIGSNPYRFTVKSSYHTPKRRGPYRFTWALIYIIH